MVWEHYARTMLTQTMFSRRRALQDESMGSGCDRPAKESPSITKRITSRYESSSTTKCRSVLIAQRKKRAWEAAVIAQRKNRLRECITSREPTTNTLLHHDWMLSVIVQIWAIIHLPPSPFRGFRGGIRSWRDPGSPPRSRPASQTTRLWRLAGGSKGLNNVRQPPSESLPERSYILCIQLYVIMIVITIYIYTHVYTYTSWRAPSRACRTGPV